MNNSGQRNLIKTNIIVPAKIRAPNSILVAVNRTIAVNNPTIKKTKSGKRYIEHEQVPRQSAHPACFCHKRTYLSPHDDYFMCEDCKEIHHVFCNESIYEESDEITFALWNRCATCIFKRANKPIA